MSDEESRLELMKRFSVDSVPSRYSQSSIPLGSRPDLSRSTTSASKQFDIRSADPKIPKNVLIIWKVSIILMFLSAGILLYLLTCSDPTWRSQWSVVKVQLPSNQFSIIKSNGKKISQNAQTSSLAGEGEGGGWLSINMWGWCLQDSSKSETLCSSDNMWFDLDPLLGEKSTSDAPSGDDFNFLLTHGLIIHALGMLAAMMAIIPIILNTFRTVRAKQPMVESGWFEHGTLLIACLLCLISFIIDRTLKLSVSNNLSDHKVISGKALTITGVSSLLLFYTLLLSSIPPFYFHMKRQSRLVKYWTEFQDYDEALADEDQKSLEAKRKRPSSRSRGKKPRRRRLSRAIFGDEDYYGSGPRRRGTLSRWASGRRDRRRRRRNKRDDKYQYESRTRDERRERDKYGGRDRRARYRQEGRKRR
ncbi:uncharacterized protein IL334_001864 [Kwoniella shivajii]|uniref:Integral membrane protein n=1 Tax=Kwoniella shivajii TaxID=564305 RepID=A0ABZ1CUQ6_9TREE|nr:hypothetical protein IL334_001864 [Kwoniella shivajii]